MWNEESDESLQAKVTTRGGQKISEVAYILDLVEIQDVRWDKRGTERAEDFFCGKGLENL